jgi:hypothetical protein
MKYLIKMGIVVLIGILAVALLPNFLVKILPTKWFEASASKKTYQYYVVYPREMQAEVYGVYDAQKNLRAVYPVKATAEQNAKETNGTVQTIPSMP